MSRASALLIVAASERLYAPQTSCLVDCALTTEPRSPSAAQDANTFLGAFSVPGQLAHLGSLLELSGLALPGCLSCSARPGSPREGEYGP